MPIHTKRYHELKAKEIVYYDWDDLKDTLEAYDDDFVDHNANIIKPINDLFDEVTRLYSQDEEGKYPALTPQIIKKLQDLYRDAISAVESIKKQHDVNRNIKKKQTKQFADILRRLKKDQKIVAQLNMKDDLPLPAATYMIYHEFKNTYLLRSNPTIVEKEFKEPGFGEYARCYLVKGQKDMDSILDEYIKLSPQKVLAKYKKMVDEDIKLYEYFGQNTNLSPRIRNTGNIEEIEDYLSINGNKITYPEKKCLQQHIASTKKAAEIQKMSELAMKLKQELAPKASVTVEGNSVAVIDVKQTAFQSSTCGCWASAAQLLLQSRGIKNVTQEDIRSYRPNLGKDEVVTHRDGMDKAYNSGDYQNLMEMGDSILAFAPNSMLNERTITGYSRDYERKGISSATYVSNTVNQMKRTLLHAIGHDHSPVAMLVNDHYITIVGIVGNTIQYKDSRQEIPKSNGKTEKRKNPDATHQMNIRDFVQYYFVTAPENKRMHAINLTWISDIKLSKEDNKTLLGVPSDYAHMKEDGTVQLPPNEISSIAQSELQTQNKIGVRVHMSGGNENAPIEPNFDDLAFAGVSFTDKVYIPKKLNAKYLKDMAELRSDEQEKALRANDKWYYHIDYPRKHFDQVLPNGAQPAQDIQGPHIDLSPEASRLKSLREESKRLYRELKKSSTLSSSRKPEYGRLIEKLDELYDLSNSAWKRGARDGQLGNINQVDFQKMVRILSAAIISCSAYLNIKYLEIKNNPYQRIDPKKQSLEQKRIKSVIDTYEMLLVMQEKFKLNNAPSAEERKDIIGSFRRELISDSADMDKQQRVSFENRMEFPAYLKPKMERLEAVFGFKTDSNTELDQAFGKNAQNRSVLRDVPAVKDVFDPIGSNINIHKLSEKDFIALAFGATFTARAQKAAFPNVPDCDRTGYLLLEGRKLPEFLVNDQLGDGRLLLSGFKEARSVAVEALEAYERGNKGPLSNLIQDSIYKMVLLAKSISWDEDRGCLLYYSEMGQRMIGMLERDPELMQMAMRDGLDPADLNYLHAMGKEGLLAEKRKQYQEEIQLIMNGTMPDWDQKTKDERYPDLLMNEYLVEERYANAENLKLKLRFQNEVKEINKMDAKIKHDAEKSFFENIAAAYDKVPAFRQILQKYRNDMRDAENNLNHPNEQKLQKCESDFANAMNTLAGQEKNVRMNYEHTLLGRFQTEIAAEESTRAQTNMPPMTFAEKCQFAVDLEYDRLYQSNPKPNDYDQASSKYIEYVDLKQRTNLYDEAMNRRVGMIQSTQKIIQARIKMAESRHRNDNLTVSSMANPESLQKERLRMKKYIQKRRFHNYNAYDFWNSTLGWNERQNSLNQELRNSETQGFQFPAPQHAPAPVQPQVQNPNNIANPNINNNNNNMNHNNNQLNGHGPGMLMH